MSPPDGCQWSPPPAAPAVGVGEVHVWRASLGVSGAAVDAMSRNLSVLELERAARFRFESLRNDYIVARGTLRAILGCYRNEDPAAVPLATTDRGKPYLAGDQHLRFSVSHSGGLALYAVSGGRHVGVDVEEVVASVDGEALAARFFSPGEREALSLLPRHERLRGFFDCWTRKEAFVKARGEGLYARLDCFQVAVGPAVPVRIVSIEGDPSAAARWSLISLNAGEGYAAALAVEAHSPALWCWQCSAPGESRPAASQSIRAQ